MSFSLSAFKQIKLSLPAALGCYIADKRNFYQIGHYAKLPIEQWPNDDHFLSLCGYEMGLRGNQKCCHLNLISKTPKNNRQVCYNREAIHGNSSAYVSKIDVYQRNEGEKALSGACEPHYPGRK